jgi:urease accessory protein
MNPALLSLLQLSDPALPIGSYAHSGGLETYVQEGVVHDAASARHFVREMLRANLFYTDAALVALAHEAATTGETAAESKTTSTPEVAAEPKNAAARETLEELDILCEAVKLPREMREASRKLGGRLLKIFGPVTGTPSITHYPVVFGYCAARLAIPRRETLTGFYYNAAAGMITNCVKLIPLGQQEGQTLLFSLHPLIGELTEKGLQPDRSLIGRSCVALDIRCMQHEQLYSRLYMS